ncbi:MAG: transposase [Actinomycetota bacterium]
MPRPLRTDPEAGWHHVMNRGVNRQTIFFDDNCRVEFGQRLADIHEQFGIEIHAYCLMTNHYHLILHCPTGGLSAGMKQLGAVYARHVNDRVGRDGPLFRGRFNSRLIGDDRYLLTAVRYVHRNALDLPDCSSVDRYRWSSHRTYLGHRPAPAWLRTTHVLSYFDGDTALFDRFVQSDLDPQATSTPGSVEAIIAAAQLVVDELCLDTGSRARSVARALALSQCATRRDTELVAHALGITSSGAIRRATQRAQAAVRDDPLMSAAVARTASLVALVSATSGARHETSRSA